MEREWGIWFDAYDKWLGRTEGTQRVLLVGNPGCEACTFENKNEFLAFVKYGKEFFGIKE